MKSINIVSMFGLLFQVYAWGYWWYLDVEKCFSISTTFCLSRFVYFQKLFGVFSVSDMELVHFVKLYNV
jgi:hypothetical protein